AVVPPVRRPDVPDALRARRVPAAAAASWAAAAGARGRLRVVRHRRRYARQRLLAARLLRRRDLLLPAARNAADRRALGPSRAPRAGVQHPGAVVSRRVSVVRQLSGDLPRTQQEAAAGARRPFRRSVLWPLHLWLADRAVRRLFQRRNGAVVGGVRALARAGGAYRFPLLARDREPLPLAPPSGRARRGDASRRRGKRLGGGGLRPKHRPGLAARRECSLVPYP